MRDRILALAAGRRQRRMEALQRGEAILNSTGEQRDSSTPWPVRVMLEELDGRDAAGCEGEATRPH